MLQMCVKFESKVKLHVAINIQVLGVHIANNLLSEIFTKYVSAHIKIYVELEQCTVCTSRVTNIYFKDSEKTCMSQICGKFKVKLNIAHFLPVFYCIRV